VNSYAPEIHGDGFKAYVTLEPYSRNLDGIFFFDSGLNPVKPTVVLVHGNGDEADTWRHVFQPLAKSFRVLALDLPGFGRSVPPQNGNLESLASALSSFLEALKLPKVHLVGSSMGAVICTMYASQHPQRVASLTLVGGASLDSNELETNPGIKSLLEPGMGENYYNGLRSLGQDAAFATLEPYYAKLHAMPKPDLEFLNERVWARVWSDTQRDAFLAALRSLFDSHSQHSKTVSKLEHLPMQLIWGAHDRIVPIQAALDMQQLLPHAQLEVIDGAGHLPHQEQPEAFLKVIESFLSNLEAQS
jgi:pimeloyl-ACP methyl ester carboxylesterase